MKKVFVITGTTASGKTALAIDFAKKINGEIICADSRIVYKDLDIVSAKPDEIERNGVVHHLIDIKTPDEGIYSAGDFVSDAKKILEKTDKPIIIQGGTWFYIKSLLDEENLPEFGKNEELRKKLSKYTDEELYEILKSKDSLRAEKIHPNNRDKVVRSIELIEALGGKISEYKRSKNKDYDAKWYITNFSREEIYQRINLRVDLMFEAGLYYEWQKNSKKYPDNEILYNTIGYKEFFELEKGIYKNIEEAKDKIKQHTRNFAKRQMTFFKQNIEKYNIKKISTYNEIEI